MNSTNIEAHNIHFNYGDTKVLRGLDLTLNQGDIYGFIGPNGAGKTTMIKILLGLLTPSRGNVHLFGKPLRSNHISIMRQIGCLIETPAFYPHLSALENLELQAIAYGVSKKRCLDVLALVGLSDTFSKRLKHFSLGMKQRLGLGMALLHNPKLLILDEPANGLDPQSIQALRLLLIRLSQEERITIFLSSHILSELEQVISRLAIINHGQKYYEGSIAELKKRSSGELHLSVDNPEAALADLEELGYQGTLERENEVLLEVTSESEIAKVNAQLVQRRFAITKLLFEQPNLEKIFLSMINEEPERGMN
ncbi:MAG: ABC transporter ATP-binding protein [candidate division Zixibacteria bacterium]